MDTGIYYLYEYKKNQKLRNAGFLKINRQYQTCFLHLNARGIAVIPEDTLKLLVFYSDNGTVNAAPLSEIACNDHTISAKITVKESQFPEHRPLNRIDGFFLVLPDNQIIAAMSDNVAFDTESIRYSTAKEPAPVIADTPDTPAPAPASGSDARAVSVEDAYSAGNDSGAAVCAEDTYSAANNSDGAVCAEDAYSSDNGSGGAVCAEAEDTYSAGNDADSAVAAASDTAPAAYEDEDSPAHSAAAAASTDVEPRYTVKKIRRSELSSLPRKHWNIANNSFLLHGYYNYNHLLLVEEDGHHWLGVPGIYDPRECRAAELFGFSQFTDSYNRLLSLSEEECNSYGRFGYWCRYLK